MRLGWTCDECGAQGELDDAALWYPHDCLSDGPYALVSSLTVDEITPENFPEFLAREAEKRRKVAM